MAFSFDCRSYFVFSFLDKMKNVTKSSWHPVPKARFWKQRPKMFHSQKLFQFLSVFFIPISQKVEEHIISEFSKHWKYIQETENENLFGNTIPCGLLRKQCHFLFLKIKQLKVFVVESKKLKGNNTKYSIRKTSLMRKTLSSWMVTFLLEKQFFLGFHFFFWLTNNYFWKAFPLFVKNKLFVKNAICKDYNDVFPFFVK